MNDCLDESEEDNVDELIVSMKSGYITPSFRASDKFCSKEQTIITFSIEATHSNDCYQVKQGLTKLQMYMFEATLDSDFFYNEEKRLSKKCGEGNWAYLLQEHTIGSSLFGAFPWAASRLIHQIQTHSLRLLWEKCDPFRQFHSVN